MRMKYKFRGIVLTIQDTRGALHQESATGIILDFTGDASAAVRTAIRWSYYDGFRDGAKHGRKTMKKAVRRAILDALKNVGP